MIDYKPKYLKYKAKYLTAKKINISGGKLKIETTWDLEQKNRYRELSSMSNTNSFIKKEDITETNMYQMNDGGNRPFQVTCDKNGVTIQKAVLAKQYGSQSFTATTFYGEPFWRVKNFEGYWSGFDSSTDEDHGNAILIKINKNNYVFVGDEIYEFKTDDEIIDFIAVVGNNAVPYPVAYGIENAYFFLEKSYIPIMDLQKAPTVANATDMYDEIYGINGIEKVESYHIRKIKMISHRHNDYEFVDSNKK
uniref:Uncharacterized protein n=1 Tax=viral metagenome TaxID=1070528 RepID=A0A6C0CA85_9ZZZZ